MSPPTNQHPAFYRPDALPVAQPTVSMHWSEKHSYPMFGCHANFGSFVSNSVSIMIVSCSVVVCWRVCPRACNDIFDSQTDFDGWRESWPKRDTTEPKSIGARERQKRHQRETGSASNLHVSLQFPEPLSCAKSSCHMAKYIHKQTGSPWRDCIRWVPSVLF